LTAERWLGRPGGQFAKFPLNYAISVMESEFVAEDARRAGRRVLPGQQGEEWQEYRRHLSEFELDRYLGVL
jgi:hypothetical protein